MNQLNGITVAALITTALAFFTLFTGSEHIVSVVYICSAFILAALSMILSELQKR